MYIQKFSCTFKSYRELLIRTKDKLRNSMLQNSFLIKLNKKLLFTIKSKLLKHLKIKQIEVVK